MRDKYLEGRIYISSAFTNLRYVKCKPNPDWLDNDPHFWNSPPTWGICRTDFRKKLDEGDYIFFVLPKYTNLPQMIYGYIGIESHIDHWTAYKTFRNKRMKNGNPNGNIIVDANNYYNKYDFGIHKKKFESIRKHYIVGDPKSSRFLTPKEIIMLAPSFLTTLNQVFEVNAQSIFEIIGRKGRVLSEFQVNKLLSWINTV